MLCSAASSLTAHLLFSSTHRSISVVDTQGASTSLCRENNLKSKQACTVIADTGYDALVVTQSTPRNALINLLQDDAPVCAMTLKVCTYVPMV